MTINIIEDFINNNTFDFSATGSELNGNCTIIAGYALYKGIDDIEKLINSFIKTRLGSDQKKELRTVFKHAKNNNYGDWWNIETNRNMYNL